MDDENKKLEMRIDFARVIMQIYSSVIEKDNNNRPFLFDPVFHISNDNAYLLTYLH